MRITDKQIKYANVFAFKSEVGDRVYTCCDVHTLTSNDEETLKRLAKTYKYKPTPNNSSISAIVHLRFFQMLQKVWRARHKDN